MARTDYASIVLSQTAPRQQAIRDASAARQRRVAQQGEDIRGFGAALAEIPNIIKRKQADDEVKSVSAAYLGSLSMDGDHEGALQAVKSLGPGLKTTEGIKAAMGLALQANTMRHQRIAEEADRQASRIQQAKFDMESKDHERRLRGEADIAELLRPQLDEEAMRGMSSVSVDAPPMTSPSVTDPGFVESALSRGNARMGDPGMTNLLALREQNSRAQQEREARAALAADRLAQTKEAAANKEARAAAVKSYAKSIDVPFVDGMTMDDVLQWAKYRDEKNKPEKPAPEDPATKAARIRQAQIDIDRANHVGPDFRPQEGGQVTEAGRMEFQRRKELADFDVKRAEREVAKWEKILNSEKDKALWSAANKMDEDAADTALRQKLVAAEKALDDALEAQRKTLEVPVSQGAFAGAKPSGAAGASDPFLDAMPPAAREDFLKLSPAEQAKVRKAMESK